MACQSRAIDQVSFMNITQGSASSCLDEIVARKMQLIFSTGSGLSDTITTSLFTNLDQF